MKNSAKPVIVVSRQLPKSFTKALKKLGQLRIAGDAVDSSVFDAAAIYVTPALDAVTADLIARLPASVGLIASIGVGTDHIDLGAAAARGIQVSNTPVVTEDTADLTWALLLATCRLTGLCERQLRAGHWELAASNPGMRVHGKTLGIVGFGAIGQAVARRATGFGMRVIYHCPHPKLDAERWLGVEYRYELESLLVEADIVSLNCALTDATHHLLNAERLQAMKTGAVLINTGRGPLIDEKALAESLAAGHLGAVGLDVFEFEPEITPQLLEFDNVTVLPHIGSATQECRTDMATRASANIKAYLSEGKALDICN